MTDDLHRVTDDLHRFYKVQAKRHDFAPVSGRLTEQLLITCRCELFQLAIKVMIVTDDLRFVTDDLRPAQKIAFSSDG